MNYDLDTLWESMVKIVDPNGKTVGSGFFIRDNGYIITCHHVIFSLDVISVKYKGENYPASWCEDLSKVSADIAILKIDIHDVPEVQLSVPKDQIVSAIVYGFPAHKAVQFTKGFDIRGTLENSSPINTLSTYIKYPDVSERQPWNKKPEPDDTFWAYKIDSGVSSGISGGLVIDIQSGDAIGVIQASTSKESYAIKWKNISEELKKISINPDNVAAFSTVALRHQKTSASGAGKISYLPSKSYRELLGRQDDIDNIMSALLDESGRRIISIDGIGGIGKTALAQEVVEQALNNKFSDVVWLTAAEKEGSVKMTFDSVLDGIADQLNAPSLLKLEGEARLSKTRELLLQKKALIVLDNMETAEDPQQEIADQLFTIIGSSKALLTSRYRFKSSSSDIYTIHLSGIDKDASYVLIRDTALEKNMPYVLGVNEADLEPIIDVVGNVKAGYSPLALKFMVGQLMEYDPETIISYMQKVQINSSPSDLSYNVEFQKFWSSIFAKSFRLMGKTDKQLMYLMSRMFEPNIGTGEVKLIQAAMKLNSQEFLSVQNKNWRISFLEIGAPSLNISGRKRIYLHRLTFSLFSSLGKKRG